MRQALSTIANYTNSDVLITPGTTGTVSINLRSRTAEEAITLIAASAGLSVAKVGSSHVVGPAEEVRRATAQLGTTEVITLSHIKPADAKEMLSRAAPRVSAEAAGNTIVLSGLQEDLEVARAALRELDVEPARDAPKPETSVLSLQYADPENAERVLRQAFPSVKFTRQEKMLTLTGQRADLQDVDKAFKALDVAPPKDPEARETAVYRLKYLNAKRAEDSLKKVLPNLIAVAGPEPTAPPPAIFQPLSLGMLGGTNGSSGGFTFSGTGTGTAIGGIGAGGSGEYQPLSRSTQLILSGMAADIATARTLLDATDVPPPLVRIEAALVEVTKSNALDLGIRWDFSNTGVTFTVPGGNGLHFGSMQLSDLSFRATLQLLLTKNRARILASPNISVVDNEDANIFIGDLVRFRGINVVSPNVGTVQGTETIPVGIALLVRPHIHPEGDVTMKVHPVISTVTAIIDGLPQTASREADTTVRLARGEQLVIGGLDRSDFTRTEQRVPGLGDIPLIGELFRTRTRTNARTEVVVIIRAYPVVTEGAPPNVFPRPYPDVDQIPGVRPTGGPTR